MSSSIRARLVPRLLWRPMSPLSPPASGLRSSASIRLASSSSSSPSSSFQTGPSPPRLPPSEQAEFERLQRVANTQEGFNPTSTPASLHEHVRQPQQQQQQQQQGAGAEDGRLAGSVPLRKGAPPEFEGDVNPKTGEVGGPRNEPQRWGPTGDYSYNGRVTDF